jgi:hypothetical protein
MKVNWDCLPATWSFDYEATTNRSLFSTAVSISCKRTEPTITGVIQPMVLDCQEDIDILDDWFATKSKLVYCPVFYRCPVVFNGMTSYYDNINRCVRWENSPNSYSGGYYTGVNANNGFNVINPLLPVLFKLDICPEGRGYEYTRANSGLAMEVGSISFKVRPRLF